MTAYRRPVRATLIDHIDERDSLVRNVRRNGSEYMRRSLLDALLHAKDETATVESVRAALDGAVEAFLRVQVATHYHAVDQISRQAVERRASPGTIGGPIGRTEQAARRVERVRRLVVVGGPKTGKTTRALTMEGRIRHTDDVQDMAWSDASEDVATWFGEPGPWVVEGVATARALRKWLAAHPEGKPCDEVLVLSEPVTERTPGQAAMAEGVATVWAEIAPVLAERGVKVSG